MVEIVAVPAPSGTAEYSLGVAFHAPVPRSVKQWARTGCPAPKGEAAPLHRGWDGHVVVHSQSQGETPSSPSPERTRCTPFRLAKQRMMSCLASGEGSVTSPLMLDFEGGTWQTESHRSRAAPRAKRVGTVPTRSFVSVVGWACVAAGVVGPYSNAQLFFAETPDHFAGSTDRQHHLTLPGGDVHAEPGGSDLSFSCDEGLGGPRHHHLWLDSNGLDQPQPRWIRRVSAPTATRLSPRVPTARAAPRRFRTRLLTLLAPPSRHRYPVASTT